VNPDLSTAVQLHCATAGGDNLLVQIAAREEGCGAADYDAAGGDSCGNAGTMFETITQVEIHTCQLGARGGAPMPPHAIGVEMPSLGP